MRPHPTAIAFDFSGLRLRLSGLPDALGRRLEEHWARFLAPSGIAADVDLHVEVGGEPLPPGKTMRPGMRADLLGERARYELAEGWVEIDASGRGRARIAPGDPGRQMWAAINLAMAAAGWRLPFRSGAMLHAAGVVLEGRAFVLVGPEGAGKTTWARIAAREGADVLSDDVVVLEGAGGSIEALSTPFRTETFPPLGPGRWPVAALLLPEHGSPPGLKPVSRLALSARLAANLLYLSGAPGNDPRPARVLDLLVGSIPARTLVFALNPEFVPLLRALTP